MESSSPSSKKKNKKDKILTPHDLVKKHMHDPTHIITDEEFNSLKMSEDAEDEKAVTKETNEKEDELDHLPNKNSSGNSYTVLGGTDSYIEG